MKIVSTETRSVNSVVAHMALARMKHGIQDCLDDDDGELGDENNQNKDKEEEEDQETITTTAGLSGGGSKRSIGKRLDHHIDQNNGGR
jgi:hypothetical protein